MTNKARAEALFVQADKQEELGNLRSAFRMMLSAAKLGEVGAQLNVGTYYADGKGVRRNVAAALYWYKRAYRRRLSCAASNIGMLWRSENKPDRALRWFFRAVALGDPEANLEIGKHYLQNEHNPRKAIPFLNRVTKASWVTEAGREEAARLCARAQKALKTRASAR